MYPAYHEVAKLQGEEGAVRTTKLAMEAERVHADLYRQAKEGVLKGEDLKVQKIYVCPVCGYTVLDEAPDKCPICSCPGEKFVEF